MLRYIFSGLVALVVIGAVRAPHEADSKRAIDIAESPEPLPAAATSSRPGEPSLVLDDAARLTRGANGHFSSDVSVNGQAVEMVVDTGATAVALTVVDAQRLGIAVDPSRFAVVGTGASGPVMGQAVTLDDVAVGGRHVAGVEAAVLAGLDRSLLGQSYLRRLARVQIDGDTMTLR